MCRRERRRRRGDTDGLGAVQLLTWFPGWEIITGPTTLYYDIVYMLAYRLEAHLTTQDVANPLPRRGCLRVLPRNCCILLFGHTHPYK